MATLTDTIQLLQSIRALVPGTAIESVVMEATGVLLDAFDTDTVSARRVATGPLPAPEEARTILAKVGLVQASVPAGAEPRPEPPVLTDGVWCYPRSGRPVRIDWRMRPGEGGRDESTPAWMDWYTTRGGGHHAEGWGVYLDGHWRMVEEDGEDWPCYPGTSERVVLRAGYPGQYLTLEEARAYRASLVPTTDRQTVADLMTAWHWGSDPRNQGDPTAVGAAIEASDELCRRARAGDPAAIAAREGMME